MSGTRSEPGPSTPIPGYQFIVRDWQTLDIIGRITRPVSASWTHRLYSASDFRLTFYDDPEEMVRAADLFVLTAADELDVEEHVVEIRRDGEVEFAGMIDHGTLDDASGLMTISGLCLSCAWLSGRIIIPDSGDAADVQAGIAAGTAITHYIDGQFVAPSDSDRDVDNELSGVTWVEGSVAAGNTISYSARYVNLHTAVQSLARVGDLIPAVGFNATYTQYVFTASAPADKTLGTANQVVFSAKRQTGEVTFVSDRRNYANALTVLGQGEGVNRTTILRENSDDLGSHRRRESLVDARNVATKARLTITALPTENETVTVGSKVYRYRDPGNLAAANDVLIGADRNESLQNLRAAITGGAGSGTLYHASTTVNTAVFINFLAGDVLEIVASGTTSTVSLAETLAAGSWNQASITLATLEAYGDAEIGLQTAKSKSISVEVNLGRISYRDDFQLGDDVTALIERLGELVTVSERIGGTTGAIRFDRRIVEVAVSIDERQYETVNLTLGHALSTLPQKLAGSLASLNNVIAE